MPQELHVLRCYSCQTFQVHIVKKSNKWECKICGEKQSIKKVYGRGSGKDCRLHVQKLNEMHMKETEAALETVLRSQEGAVDAEQMSGLNFFPVAGKSQVGVSSMWSKFLSEEAVEAGVSIPSPKCLMEPKKRTSAGMSESAYKRQALCTAEPQTLLCDYGNMCDDSLFLNDTEISCNRNRRSYKQGGQIRFGSVKETVDDQWELGTCHEHGIGISSSADGHECDSNVEVNIPAVHLNDTPSSNIPKCNEPAILNCVVTSDPNKSSHILINSDYSEEELDSILSF
ncbi:uncharacterized protein [Periplaneta americana]|uniref:uncharacterized protein n=1 Tax=Periplaneta americana TaxID=6978 RepID=UPI0037E827F3